MATASASSHAELRRPSMSKACGRTGSGRTYLDWRTRTPARRAVLTISRRRLWARSGTCTRTGWMLAARQSRRKRSWRLRDTASLKGFMSPPRCWISALLATAAYSSSCSSRWWASWSIGLCARCLESTKGVASASLWSRIRCAWRK